MKKLFSINDSAMIMSVKRVIDIHFVISNYKSINMWIINNSTNSFHQFHSDAMITGKVENVIISSLKNVARMCHRL